MKNVSIKSLEDLRITEVNANWNLSPEKLTEISLSKNYASLANSGAISINTGEFTGRSPKDRFVVKDNTTENAVWWGDVNIPFNPEKYNALYNKVTEYLRGKDVYVRDVYACADENFRLNIRVINEYPWSNLFTYNMFLRPTRLKDEFYSQHHSQIAQLEQEVMEAKLSPSQALQQVFLL